MIVYRLRRQLRYSKKQESATVRLAADYRDQFALLELDGDPDFVDLLRLDGVGGVRTLDAPGGVRTTPQELAWSMDARFSEYHPELIEGSEVLQRRQPPSGSLAEQRAALAGSMAGAVALCADIVGTGSGMAFVNVVPQLGYVEFLWSHWRKQGGDPRDPGLARAFVDQLAESRVALDNVRASEVLGILTTTLERDGETTDGARLRDDIVAALRAAPPA